MKVTRSLPSAQVQLCALKHPQSFLGEAACILQDVRCDQTVPFGVRSNRSVKIKLDRDYPVHQLQEHIFEAIK